MLNNWIPTVLYVILKQIYSAWKGCEIMFTNNYSKS